MAAANHKQTSSQPISSHRLEELRAKAFRYANAHLRNRHDAEDIAQKSIDDLLAKLDSIDDLEKFFRTIVRRRVFDEIRRRSDPRRPKPSGSSFEEIQAVTTQHPDGKANDDEVREQLWKAVDGLPTVQATVMRLRYNLQYSNQEIAEVLGISYENTCVLHHRAVEKLRSILEQIGFG